MLSNKAKWKRAKFDPDQMKTVSQLSQKLAEKKRAVEPKGS